MRTAERFRRFVEYFSVNRPVAETELDYRNPYELLVAVILSAQCTDKRVNMITPAFFRTFPNVAKLAGATAEEVLQLIKSCSYPNNKARHLVGMAQTVMLEFEGEIPKNTEDLQKLPGVGRKTAHVIAAVAYNQPKMPVDTHVFRVSERIGLSRGAKNPLQTEMQLIRYLPEDKIPLAHHWLILHGRYVCKARKPLCSECGIQDICRYYGKKLKRDGEGKA